MSERKVMYFIKVGKGVVGFAMQNGVSLVSSLIDSTNMSKREIERNFVARFAAQRIFAIGKGNSDGGLHWEFEWLDYDKVITCNLFQLPLEQTTKPVKKTSKPKIYEIQNKDGGFFVVKHDKELLDEDEVKLKLFEKSVNE